MKTIKVTVNLTPQMYEHLCTLESKTGTGSKASIMRKGLEIYGKLVNEVNDGYDIKLKKGNKEKFVLIV
jgi:predicted DNA-binding protein